MEGGPQEPPPGEEGLNLIIEPDKLAGVWANWAQVSHSLHEFTLDFVRLDPIQQGRGIVVARVSVSPLFITQLIDALQDNWAKYAEKAMPKEVQGDGPDEDDQPEGSRSLSPSGSARAHTRPQSPRPRTRRVAPSVRR